MEVTFNADKKLLDTLNSLIGAVNALVGVTQGMTKSSPAPEQGKPEKEEALVPEAAEEAPPWNEEPKEAKKPTVSREEVNQLAILKIQAKHRDGVKALLEKYGVSKVGAVPEEHLAAFKAELEAL